MFMNSIQKVSTADSFLKMLTLVFIVLGTLIPLPHLLYAKKYILKLITHFKIVLKYL